MAQFLRVLVVHPEDPGSNLTVPSTHVCCTTAYDSDTRGIPHALALAGATSPCSTDTHAGKTPSKRNKCEI